MSVKSNIQELVRLDVSLLDPFKHGNPRTMPESMKLALSKSMEEFGVIEPVVVRAVTKGKKKGRYEVLGGHHRLEELRSRGEAQVDALVVSVPDDSKARALVLALNNISADWNLESLKQYVADFDKEWLSGVTGFSMEDFEELARVGEQAFAGAQVEEVVPVSDTRELVRNDPQQALARERCRFVLRLLPEQFRLYRAAQKKGRKMWGGCSRSSILGRIAESFLGRVPTVLDPRDEALS